MHRPKSDHTRGDRATGEGFTLLELLIAIALFATVLSVVYGVYRTTFATIYGSEDRVRQADNGRLMLERIVEDLENLRLGLGGMLLAQEHELGGNRADSLLMVTESHLRLRREDGYRGPALVRYQVEENDDGEGLLLYRTDQILRPGGNEGDGEAKQYLLGRNLAGLAFTFVDDEGVESESWDSAEQEEEEGKVDSVPELPVLIRIELQLLSDPQDFESAPLVYRTAVSPKPVTGEKE